MEQNKDQLFTVVETNIKEFAHKLRPEEIEGILITIKMAAEELAYIQEKNEVILLEAENSHLRDINSRKDILLNWYRRNVEF